MSLRVPKPRPRSMLGSLVAHLPRVAVLEQVYGPGLLFRWQPVTVALSVHAWPWEAGDSSCERRDSCPSRTYPAGKSWLMIISIHAGTTIKPYDFPGRGASRMSCRRWCCFGFWCSLAPACVMNVEAHAGTNDEPESASIGVCRVVGRAWPMFCFKDAGQDLTPKLPGDCPFWKGP